MCGILFFDMQNGRFLFTYEMLVNFNILELIERNIAGKLAFLDSREIITQTTTITNNKLNNRKSLSGSTWKQMNALPHRHPDKTASQDITNQVQPARDRLKQRRSERASFSNRSQGGAHLSVECQRNLCRWQKREKSNVHFMVKIPLVEISNGWYFFFMNHVGNLGQKVASAVHVIFSFYFVNVKGCGQPTSQSVSHILQIEH